MAGTLNSVLKYVGRDGKFGEKQSLQLVNKEFFAKFNATRTSKVVFQQAVRVQLHNLG